MLRVQQNSAFISRELFEMARTKKACLIFFDEIDAVGGARFDDGAGGDNEVQRTMLELINQLDGFDPRGNIKVLMATNRWDSIIIKFIITNSKVHSNRDQSQISIFMRDTYCARIFE